MGRRWPVGSATGAGPRPWVRAAVVVTGTVVVSAAAVGGGLWLTGDDPDQPHGGDAHTSAPPCGVVPEDAVARALPGAVLETDTGGPLAGGEGTACVWTTAGLDTDPQGVLRVDLSARFTDASAEPVVTGDEAAARAQEDVVPQRGRPVELGSGGRAEVWRGQVPGTAELAFHHDNLLVRVSYSAVEEDDPVPFDRARETVVGFAEQLGEVL
ncbi:hypothetical protein [Nocardiopsis sp. NPDC006938]|uniref:hypothetical protein n=1 Tax=Nocardiopsis sp. NPDC006938 TaxID=3364337 RepID=UPI0036BA961E